MTKLELAEALEGVPVDPRTGYPPGYLWFVNELEARTPRPQAKRGMTDEEISEAMERWREDLKRKAQESLR